MVLFLLPLLLLCALSPAAGALTVVLLNGKGYPERAPLAIRGTLALFLWQPIVGVFVYAALAAEDPVGLIAGVLIGASICVAGNVGICQAVADPEGSTLWTRPWILYAAVNALLWVPALAGLAGFYLFRDVAVTPDPGLNATLSMVGVGTWVLIGPFAVGTLALLGPAIALFRGLSLPRRFEQIPETD